MSIIAERTIAGETLHDHQCDDCETVFTQGCKGECDPQSVDFCDNCEASSEREDTEEESTESTETNA